MIQVGKSLEDILRKYDIRHGDGNKCRCIDGAKSHLHKELIEFFTTPKEKIEQAEGSKEMKCIFCGTMTYFSDNNRAYCIDCYVKIRNSAHTHDLPKNTPITPTPTVWPNTITVPYKFPSERPTIIC